jgi:hypothetical protein
MDNDQEQTIAELEATINWHGIAKKLAEAAALIVGPQIAPEFRQSLGRSIDWETIFRRHFTPDSIKKIVVDAANQAYLPMDKRTKATIDELKALDAQRMLTPLEAATLKDIEQQTLPLTRGSVIQINNIVQRVGGTALPLPKR